MTSPSIGIRELRQSLSETIRRAEAGETIEVTRDGKPVALITPSPGGGALKRLVAEREVRAPTGSFDEFVRLRRLQSTTGVTASEALEEDRGE